MKKKKVIIVVVVIVVMSIVLYYLYSSSSSASGSSKVVVPPGTQGWINSSPASRVAWFATGISNGTISQSDIDNLTAMIPYWNSGTPYSGIPTNLMSWWTTFSAQFPS